MHISQIRMRGYFKYRDATIDLPANGVVLVTGNNGAGKSLLGDAVSAAIWGKSLRDARPWPKEGAAILDIKTDLMDVHREHRGNKTTLAWGENEWPTATKAQEELVSHVGRWEDWRRTSVFRSEESSVFTSATDAERKRLIESLMGVEVFDRALTACRTEMRTLARQVELAEQAKAVLEERIGGTAAQLAEAKQQRKLLSSAAPPAPSAKVKEALAATLAEVEEVRVQGDRDLKSLRQQVDAAQRSTLGPSAALGVAQRERERIDKDLCPTCEQPIQEETRLRARVAVAEAEIAAAKAKKAAEEVVARLREEIAEFEEDMEGIAGRRDTLLRDLRALDEAERIYARHQQDLEQIDARVANFTSYVGKQRAELATKGTEADQTRARLKVLEAVERVVGMEGVRVQLLGQALGGIESSANRWLSQIGWEGLKLELRPYAETASGDVRDKISLDIHGAGGGNGYGAASSGEKRRIDVALLFALAEFAAASRGVSPGTMIVDEVSDSLDTEGTAAVAEALRELAETRAVVVISHNLDLADALQPDLHLHVEDGRIRAVS